MKVITVILLLACYNTFSQEIEEDVSQEKGQEIHLSSRRGEGSFGFGLGLQYGGLGARIGVNVIDNLNIFGGVGYQLTGIGYNAGLKLDFKSETMTQFYLVGMYGTNAVLKFEGSPYVFSTTDNGLYRGITFGLGIKVNTRKREGNFLDLGLLIPIRSTKFKDDVDNINNSSPYSELSSPWPILINLGFNLNMQ